MSEMLLNLALGAVLIRYTVLAVEGIIRVLDWIIYSGKVKPQRVHRSAPVPKFKDRIYRDKNPLI